ncbi:MAG: hypothetical protein JNL58_08205 [Planctomyces sp.]|nr:hypothetical protein [Planctomyces sp.]
MSEETDDVQERLRVSEFLESIALRADQIQKMIEDSRQERRPEQKKAIQAEYRELKEYMRELYRVQSTQRARSQMGRIERNDMVPAVHEAFVSMRASVSSNPWSQDFWESVSHCASYLRGRKPSVPKATSQAQAQEFQPKMQTNVEGL